MTDQRHSKIKKFFFLPYDFGIDVAFFVDTHLLLVLHTHICGALTAEEILGLLLA